MHLQRSLRLSRSLAPVLTSVHTAAAAPPPPSLVRTQIRTLASTMTGAPVDPKSLETIKEQFANRTLKDAPPDQRHATPNEDLNARVAIWRGDLTKLRASMIVNAANKTLLGGGGVDGAIHRAAGPSLFEECVTLGGAETGQTKATSGYNLPATRVAHTVGPIYSSSKADKCAEQLASCYRSSLELCAHYGGGTIGFPSVSTGVYGYPIADATHVALKATRAFLENDTRVKRVVFVVFSAEDEDTYRRLAPQYFPRKA